VNTVTITDAVPGIPEEQDGAEPASAKSSAVRVTAMENTGATTTGSPVDAIVIRLPVDARGLSLGILATVTVVFALNWAQDFVASLMLGILFAYTLNPLVVWLEYIKIPRVLSAGIVMIAVLSVLLLGAYALQGQVQSILTQLPETASKFATSLASMSAGQRENMKNMQAAATEVAKATSEVAGIAPRQRVRNVVMDPPSFEIGNVIWAGSKGVVKFSGEAIVVVFLVFFLLLSAGTFKRKMVRLTGPSFSRKKITVHILDDINNSIQRYMFMLLLTNLLVGLLTWVAFRWIGLENAGAWAVAAGLLHVIPYLGPAATAFVTGMAALLQFGEISMVALVAGVSLAIATFIGTFVVTWMTGRIAKMNTAAVFISLLFWGWLWGILGMLLSIPIIVILKVVSQHVEQLQPVADLLGE
jgi:predicted PurR-regulated permease PerM